MRALILLLSLVVVTLAVLILLAKPEPVTVGPTFDAARLLGDARVGEEATYRDEQGRTLTLRTESVVPGGPDSSPWVRIRMTRRDKQGRILPGGQAVYDHYPAKHGLFPLVAAADPQGLDRLWVWTRIRRSSLTWQGQAREAWRFDLIDPALPAKGGEDHVVAWLDETVPVFGLVQWQRRDETWVLEDWRPR